MISKMSGIIENPDESKRAYSSNDSENSDSTLDSTGSWLVRSPTVDNDYLQIDLDTKKTISGLILQGGPNSENWVKRF